MEVDLKLICIKCHDFDQGENMSRHIIPKKRSGVNQVIIEQISKPPSLISILQTQSLPDNYKNYDKVRLWFNMLAPCTLLIRVKSKHCKAFHKYFSTIMTKPPD